MSNPFALARKYLQSAHKDDELDRQEFAHVTTRNGADILIDNSVIAVLFDWPMAGPFWLAVRDDFKSGDEYPVFFASELPFLLQMTPEELRRRYAEKKALDGDWIRNRIEH